jgi:hypothetical protein
VTAAKPSATFDVRDLAAATADLISLPSDRASWLTGRELERWLIAQGIAQPNGAVGRLELTERGADLLTNLRYW